MANLKVNFCGIEFKNPVIVSSIEPTNSVDNLKKCIDAGAAGAVVEDARDVAHAGLRGAGGARERAVVGLRALRVEEVVGVGGDDREVDEEREEQRDPRLDEVVPRRVVDPRRALPVNLPREDEAGVQVLDDDFALAERGIEGAALAEGVTATKLDTLVDHLAAGRKVSWH